MSIRTIEKFQFNQCAPVLESMYRLRAKVFSEKLGWDVAVRNGLEKDRYDEFNPLYIVKTAPGTDDVVASMRLMPTTGPTLLADVFAETMPDAVAFTAPSIWECTRFCIDEDHDYVRNNRAAVATLTAEMMLGCAEVCAKVGVEAVVANFEAPVVRLYKRLGASFDILGSSASYGKRRVYLGHFAVEQDMIDRLKAQFGIEGDIMNRRQPVEVMPFELDLAA